MKHYALILATLLSLLTQKQVWATDDLTTGSFKCKIKYQRVLEINEGKTTEYGGIVGQPNEGESFDMSYMYSKIDNQLSFHFGEMDIWSLAGSPIKPQYNDKSFKRFKGTSAHDPKITLATDESYLEMDGPLINLSLKRYYKNDWSGIYSRAQNAERMHIMGLDCRHKKDKFEDIINNLESKGF